MIYCSKMIPNHNSTIAILCDLLQGWEGLAQELSSETRRLWVRNLGRDDRVVADTGREARHPFLAEDVVETLLATPLPLVADLRLPPGAEPDGLLSFHQGHEYCGSRG